MLPRSLFAAGAFLLGVVLIAGCATPPAPAPTTTELPPTFTSTPVPTPTPTDTATPVPPTATHTPLPTSTHTSVPLTATSTPVPPTATSTPRPTLPPATLAPTQPPTAVPPTKAASVPGADVVAERGKETCVNKYVSISYPWEAEADPKGRQMYYWDAKWSVYPMYARPNIKFQTVLSDCNKDRQCKGFTADFCVYVDGGAPQGGPYETEVVLMIASMYPNRTGVHMLGQTTAQFSWVIK